MFEAYCSKIIWFFDKYLEVIAECFSIFWFLYEIKSYSDSLKILYLTETINIQIIEIVADTQSQMVPIESF